MRGRVGAALTALGSAVLLVLPFQASGADIGPTSTSSTTAAFDCTPTGALVDLIGGGHLTPPRRTRVDITLPAQVTAGQAFASSVTVGALTLAEVPISLDDAGITATLELEITGGRADRPGSAVTFSGQGSSTALAAPFTTTVFPDVGAGSTVVIRTGLLTLANTGGTGYECSPSVGFPVATASVAVVRDIATTTSAQAPSSTTTPPTSTSLPPGSSVPTSIHPPSSTPSSSTPSSTPVGSLAATSTTSATATTAIAAAVEAASAEQSTTTTLRPVSSVAADDRLALTGSGPLLFGAASVLLAVGGALIALTRRRG